MQAGKHIRTNPAFTPILLLLLAALLLPACSKQKDLVVLNKALKRERTVNLGVPDEFSNMAPAQSNEFFVEGRIQNTGTTDAREVLVTFRCAAGAERKTLTAEIPVVPAGKTVNFKTRVMTSRIELRLLEDEEPEIRYKN